MARENISGIYKIENLIDGKVYIGSSMNIYKRWKEHKTELENNFHHNIHLQRAWNKYGEGNFKFEIIEVFNGNVKELRDLEKYYFDRYDCCNFNAGYNINNNPLSCGTSAPTYQDIIDGKYKFSQQQFDDVIYFLCYTNLSIPKVAKITGVSKNSIYQIYSKYQFIDIIKDFSFVRRNDIGENSGKNILKEKDVLEIISMLIQGNSMTEIASKFNITVSTIGDIYNKRSWKHLTNNIIFPKYKKRVKTSGKPVIQYDLEGNFIATYKTAKDAEEATGIGCKMISRVCKGDRPHTHDYIFKFA